MKLTTNIVLAAIIAGVLLVVLFPLLGILLIAAIIAWLLWPEKIKALLGVTNGHDK